MNDYRYSFEPVEQTESQTAQNSTQNSTNPFEQPHGKGTQKKQRLGARIVALALVCALIGGAAGAGMTAAAYRNLASQMQTNVSSAVSDRSTGSSVSITPVSSGVIRVASNNEGKSLTPADVYASYVECVVGISAETTTNVYGQLSTAAVSGSGFVLTQDGYIITNNHVVEDANEGSIRVSLMDGSTYDAVVVGTEADNDVALLKIDAQGLKPVAVGDSDALSVGEMVCAIGNPLGELTNTETVGYISALDREINADGKPINMLQTDCAINPGNSGGPLFDLNGNVIGITTAKYSSSQLEGLCFAIPINDVMPIISDLMQYGYVKGKPFIGIQPVTIYDTYANYYNLPTGVYVYSVYPDTAAERAGMKQADIIIKMGDQEISSYSDLVAALRTYKAGDTTSVTVWRSGEEVSLLITFDEKQPEAESTQDQQKDAEKTPSQNDGSDGYIGIPSDGGDSGSSGGFSFGWPFSGFGGLFGFGE
ncbi:MAG: trypsin-like peptidase domain-containing protein [Oscillospiraceae bacterium]|nr:trypsin-like peptidase domain-containing protein [Oscillospiraceae bacterium]